MNGTKTKFRWINLRALVDDFKENRIDENLRFKYLLAEFTALTLAVSFSVQTPPVSGSEWLLNTVVIVSAVFIGTSLAYKKNKIGDDQDFVARYIALSFVLSIIFLSAFLILSIALGIFATATQNPDLIMSLQKNVALNLTIGVASLLLFYLLLVKYIGEISTSKENI